VAREKNLFARAVPARHPSTLTMKVRPSQLHALALALAVSALAASTPASPDPVLATANAALVAGDLPKALATLDAAIAQEPRVRQLLDLAVEPVTGQPSTIRVGFSVLPVDDNDPLALALEVTL
jgi:hypothetical protein